MEPFAVLTMVQVVPTIVHATKQTIEVPQMTSPQERQPKK
jgi:hypothetical protein